MAADPRAAQDVAEAARDAMYARDRAAQALGITVEKIGPGFARCRMTVREEMLNGHGTCHGGLIFTLADIAFAYACNSYDRATVALGAQISFTAPARAGERAQPLGPDRRLRRRSLPGRRNDGRVVPRQCLRDARHGRASRCR